MSDNIRVGPAVAGAVDKSMAGTVAQSGRYGKRSPAGAWTSVIRAVEIARGNVFGHRVPSVEHNAAKRRLFGFDGMRRLSPFHAVGWPAGAWRVMVGSKCDNPVRDPDDPTSRTAKPFCGEDVRT